MQRDLTVQRRSVILGAGAALLELNTAQASETAKQFAALERSSGGRLGVYMAVAGEGLLAYRANEQFLMCSTFKALLAGFVLHRVDDGRENLDRRIAYGPADLLDYAPVSKAHVARGWLTVRELCAAAVQLSDNTAANLLLREIGGPGALTQWLRSLGDPVTRLDRTEPSLNKSDFPGDERDTTTPLWMAGTIESLLVGGNLSPMNQAIRRGHGEPLSASSRQMLTDWLINCETGLHRIRAGLPKAWRVGDKTGTGGAGAANDVAVIWPPASPPVVIACFLTGAHGEQAFIDSIHAEVGRIVASRITRG